MQRIGALIYKSGIMLPTCKLRAEHVRQQWFKTKQPQYWLPWIYIFTNYIARPLPMATIRVASNQPFCSSSSILIQHVEARNYARTCFGQNPERPNENNAIHIERFLLSRHTFCTIRFSSWNIFLFFILFFFVLVVVALAAPSTHTLHMLYVYCTYLYLSHEYPLTHSFCALFIFSQHEWWIYKK